MAYMKMKRNDRKPYVNAVLKDSSSSAVDLTSASGVSFIMKKEGESSTKINASATITDASNGEVQYQWAAGDTDTAGTYLAEFEVDWGSGIYQTFPSDDSFVIDIFEDLDNA